MMVLMHEISQVQRCIVMAFDSCITVEGNCKMEIDLSV